MFTILSGIGLLLLTLAAFSLFSLKMPRASSDERHGNCGHRHLFDEAVHKYITGDLLHLSFFQEVGSVSGSMGGVAAAIMVPISMGANPVLAVVAGVAVGGYGILPGFIAGYVVGFAAPWLEKHLPAGLDTIAGALATPPWPESSLSPWTPLSTPL